MKKAFILVYLMFCYNLMPVLAANDSSATVTLPQRSIFSTNAQNLINEKNKNQDLENINSKTQTDSEEQEDLGNTLKMMNGFTNILNPFMMQQLNPHY